MPNYNTGYKYNANGDNGGLFYNTDYFVLINLRETIQSSDEINKMLAICALVDDKFYLYDAIVQSALYGTSDRFSFDEEADYSLFFIVTDSLGITDEISALIVLATLYDNQKFIEEVKQLNDIILNENLRVPDDYSIDVLLNIADKYNLTEIRTVADILFTLYDQEGIVDGTPRSAVSDFAIGVADDLDNAYDWLIPFNLKVDWNTTNIQIMPEASNTVIEMPGVDGSIVEDTVYRDRLFQIVAFSEDGLTIPEKEELKSKITEILDSTKHQKKKLTVQARGNSFDVKYDGQASITDGPSYVKATIPFRTSPYGYKTFEGELHGSGLVYNEGEAPIGPRHVITGPITNPTFTLGNIQYRFNGEVPYNYSLIIDHQMMTCYFEDMVGIKTNALSGLTGKFQKIPAHKSVALTASGALNNQIYTTWRDRILW